MRWVSLVLLGGVIGCVDRANSAAESGGSDGGEGKGGDDTSGDADGGDDGGSGDSDGDGDGGEPDPDVPCGDGVLGPDEVCDDGNRIDGDGCNRDCTPSGRELWTYRGYHGAELSASAVATDAAGNIVITGHVDVEHVVDGNIKVRPDVVLVSLDPEGGNRWTRTWHNGICDELHCDEGGDYGHDVAIDGQGTIVVAGSTNLHQALLQGYDGQGEALWTEIFRDGSFDTAYAVAVEPSGAFWAGGYLLNYSFDMRVSRFQGDRTEVWTTHYDGDGDDGGETDMALALAADGKGNVIVAGYSNSNDADALLAKYDASGELVWMRISDEYREFDRFESVAIDPEGNIITAGQAPGNGRDLWVRKHDPKGDVVWSLLDSGEDDPDGISQDSARGVAVDRFGYIAVIGSIDLPDGSGIWVLKLDPGGTVTWSDVYVGEGYQGAGDITIDGDGNVIAVGRDVDDLWVRKYTP